MRGETREGDLMLHITNGDCAGGILKHASLQHEAIQGAVLAWRDVLYDLWDEKLAQVIATRKPSRIAG